MVYRPSYDAMRGYYYLSPDHYEELDEWEALHGNIKAWDDDTLIEFITEVTGDNVKSFNFNRQFMLITYVAEEQE